MLVSWKTSADMTQEETLKRAGEYQVVNFLGLLDAFAAKPLREIMGMGEEEVAELLAEAKKDVKHPDGHRYTNMYFWYGQKPE